MPLFFQRSRRASEAPPVLHPPDSKVHKRFSIDATSNAHNNPAFSSMNSTKLKNLLGAGPGSGDPSGTQKKERMKKKLTTPSMFFRRNSSSSPESPKPSPGSATVAITPGNEPIMANYQDPAQRISTKPVNAGLFPSAAVSPENSVLSHTVSPETSTPLSQESITPNARARPLSQTWQPSYPLVLPDEGYADVSPNGQLPLTTGPDIVSGTGDENAQRRSTDAHVLDSRPITKPQEMVVVPPETQLPTPPLSSRVSPEIGLQNEVETNQRRPSLALITSDEVLTPKALRPVSHEQENIEAPMAAADNQMVSGNVVHPPEIHNQDILAIAPSPITHHTASSIPSISATPAMPSTPISSSSSPVRMSRPGLPVRKTTVIHSPPMPQPIRNLPTLTNLASLAGDTSSTTPTATPGWGELAKEGGPKTPGGGIMRSPISMMNGARTPGLGSFTLNLPPGKAKKTPMTEQELRKARRAMVCYSNLIPVIQRSDSVFSL